MTALFVVAASGHAFRTHFIFHSSYQLPVITDCKAEKITLRHSEKGWMTKRIFEDIIKNDLFEEIEKVRSLHLRLWNEEREKCARLAAEKAKKKLVEQGRRNAQRQGLEWTETMEEQVGLNQIPQPPNSELDYTGRPSRRALLILDGHSSRNNLSLMSWLYENEIDVILLRSHTSAYLQPLDRCVTNPVRVTNPEHGVEINHFDQTKKK
ncbi:hypothetical protein BLNAU_23138 [Blattamonas nauphoetae]|uniref:DDE-1 domain-containing protein n=1 Tax=Blattamonas nauphoetae TaxID=2049346 RepID=A0ABQ9WR54_9EUKA|nr:hypothetical protein BLNAU_23138 [Blattamonas nauphoetae]